MDCMENEEMTLKQAAKHVGCSKSLVGAAVAEGSLRARRVGEDDDGDGGFWLVRRLDVEAWNRTRKPRGRPKHLPKGSIPFVGTAGAGPGEDDPADHDDSISLSDLFPGQVAAVRVVGHSMRDRSISNGDYVIVRRQPAADLGDVVLAIHDNGHTVKRLAIADIGTRREPNPVRALVPCDGSPKGKEIQVDDSVTILGVVVGVVRKC